MKRILLSLSLFAFTSVTSAQIPEAGFENWSSGSCDEPSGWNTVNGSTSILGLCTAQQETANPNSGTSALKIQTGELGFPVFQTVPGLVSNGTIDVQNQSVNGGIPFTERPVSFSGWYRAEPVNGDSYSLIAVLINENTGDTVGASIFEGATTVNSWTQFVEPVQYLNEQIPTLLQITMFASDPLNPQDGSTVYFDDLDYQTITVDVNELASTNVSVYPNPAVDEVFFEIGDNENTTLTIYNILGLKVQEQPLRASTNQIDIATLPTGTYLWQVSSVEGVRLKTGKLQVAW